MLPTLFLIQPRKHPKYGRVAGNGFKIGITHVFIDDALIPYGSFTRIIDTQEVEYKDAKNSKTALLMHMRKRFEPYVLDSAKSLDWFIAEEKDIAREFRTFVNTLPGVKQEPKNLKALWDYDSDLDDNDIFGKYFPDADGDVIMTATHVCSYFCTKPCFIKYDFV